VFNKKLALIGFVANVLAAHVRYADNDVVSSRGRWTMAAIGPADLFVLLSKFTTRPEGEKFKVRGADATTTSRGRDGYSRAIA